MPVFAKDGKLLWNTPIGGSGGASVAGPDLMNPKAIMLGGAFAGFYHWTTPDTLLVAVETVGAGNMRVSKFQSVKTDGSGVTDIPGLTDIGGLLIEKVKVSPDGTQVAYMKGDAVFVCKPDGSGSMKVADAPSAQAIAW
jgi:hypothetical protein